MGILSKSLLLPALACMNLGNAAAQPEPYEEVPFRLYRGYMVLVEGAIGPLDGLTFLIDTGASTPVVSSYVAGKLGLKSSGREAVAYGRKFRSEITILRQLRIGSTRFPPVPALVSDLSAFLPQIGNRIDAVIGMNSLMRTRFRIDFEERVLTFNPKEDLPSSTELRYLGQLPAIQARIEDRPVTLLVDTGAPELILFRSRLDSGIAGARILGKKTLYHLGVKDELQWIRLGYLSLGTLRLEMLDGYLLDAEIQEYDGFEGIAGVTALDLRSVQFNFDEGRMSWAH